jgi:hypothetical protein
MRLRGTPGKSIRIAGIAGCAFSKDQVGLFVWAKIPATYKMAMNVERQNTL